MSVRSFRTHFIVAASLLMGGVMLAQGQGGPATTPVLNQSGDPILQGFRFRAIGPATMSGRIDDIEGVEKDPTTFYVGFATSGLWKTSDGGNTFNELFGEQPVATIGDIAIAPSNQEIVYVGSGEANNRQSSTSGNGMYKTTDGGKTWAHIGLDDTQSIARVVVHPTNPDIVYVAAMGHLFGPNAERGLFKSIDGGKTWKKVLFVNNNTGATDVVMDYSNPKIMFAAMYERVRTGWGYNGGIPNGGSGLYQSTDGGDTWKKMSAPGLPTNPILGRIAVAISRSNPKVVMAQIEVGASAGEGANVADDGGPDKQGDLVLTAGQTNFSDNQPQQGGRGQGGGGGGNFGGGRGQAPAPDSNKSGIWRSEDGGATWKFLVNNDSRPMYYTQLRIDPKNDQIVWTGGLNVTRSMDGGKTFTNVPGWHTDNHAVWIDPNDGRHVIIGHDAGIEITYSAHSSPVAFDQVSNFNAGLFYAVSADMRHPYHVCGGLQDNGSWCGPSAIRSSAGGRNGGGPILNTDWISVGGGDGFYTQNDPTDYNIFYTESQQGSMSRYNMRIGQQQSIQPRVGGRGGNVTNAPHPQMYFRFYWNTPIVLSPFDPATIYTGAQYFFKSNNRGDTWTMNPSDLTKNVDRYKQSLLGVDGMAPTASKHDGYENNSNIVTIAASPVKRGVIWAGTDDGNLQVSQDDGEHFTNVINNVNGRPRGPLDYVQVARIEASHFEAGGAYVTIDNHRNDDWKPYIFKTSDFGKTWTNVTGNLPAKGHVNVIREDLENPNLLFAGTEYGIFVSLDGGKIWKPFQNGMPNVRVDDILIHPRDRDLIVGTHGRSIWIMDDITPLEQLHKTDAAAAEPTLFTPRPAIQYKNDISMARGGIPQRWWKGQNPQGGTAINVLAKSEGTGKLEFLQNGTVASSMDVTLKAGMNRFQWAMASAAPGGQGAGGAGFGGGRGGGAQGVPFVSGGRGGGGGGPVAPGTYVVRLTVGDKTYTTSVSVLEDIWMTTER